LKEKIERRKILKFVNILMNKSTKLLILKNLFEESSEIRD
jgi:hypothetical protein